MKKFSLIGVLLLLLLGVVSCESKIGNDYDANQEIICKEEIHLEDLCLYLSNNDMDSVLSLINDFLATLPNDVCISQKLDNLESWLEAMTCITEINTLSYWTEPPTPKGVNFLFTGNDVTKRISLDFLTNPLRVYRSDR